MTVGEAGEKTTAKPSGERNTPEQLNPPAAAE